MIAASTAAPYPVQTASRSQPFNDNSSAAYPATLARQSFPLNYQASMDTHVSGQYGLQRPNHSLPMQMSQTPTINYSGPEFSQHWTPLSSNGRSMSNNFSFDPDVSSSYQSSAFPYLPTSGPSYPTATSETSSFFPGLSPLAPNLPYNSFNRTLPNPASVQSSLPSSNGSSNEKDNGMGLFQQHLDKSSEPWDTVTGTTRSSVSSAAQDPISASEPASSNSSSSPSDTNESSNLGYDHLSHSSRVSSDVDTSGLLSGNISRRMSNEDIYPTSTSRIQSNQDGSSQLPNLNSSFNVRGIHGVFGVQEDTLNSINTGASLVSGQIPPSIHHPQPQHSASHDVLPILRGSFDTKSHDPRRPSNLNAKGHKSHGKR